MATLEIHETQTQKHLNEQVKEWLWRYRRAKQEVRRLEGEYAELVSVQESVCAVKQDGMPHGSNPADLSNLIIVRDRMLTRLIRAKQNMSTVYCEIMDALDKLDNLEHTVLSLRYIQLKEDNTARNFNEIASAVCYSLRTVTEAHSTALQKLSGMLSPKSLR